MDIDIQLIIKMRYDFLIGVVRHEIDTIHHFSAALYATGLVSRLSIELKKKQWRVKHLK